MSRNAESRFAVNPTNIDISRSRLSRDSRHVTTFDAGRLIPFYVDEVLPGDTHDVRTSMVCRMPTLITPLMDNLYVDTYYFFVPNRLSWEHWKEFQGENTASAWVPTVEYSIPQLTSPASTGWITGTIADYMGIPINVAGLSVNALPFRAYGLIYNEWFRDENLIDPLNVPLTDSTVAGVNTGTYVTDVAKGGIPVPVAKYHDYFSSCLPGPLKAVDDVTIPVVSGGFLPVYTTGDDIPYADFPTTDGGQPYALHIRPTTMKDSATTDYSTWNVRQLMNNGANYSEANWNSTSWTGGIGSTWLENTGSNSGLVPSNLYAYDDGQASVATINQLRTAFQIQKLYERDARGGTRYIEILKSHFGVTSPDYRLQRPEYLGGQRFPVTITQVVQNSESGTTPLGDTAGYSLTVDVHKDFTKSFTEHGYILGLMCVRYPHTYSYGLERMWSRKQRFDFYMPVFANLGEMAVLNKEIYAQGTSADDEVFGYQEAWADYRYKPNRTSGLMRPQATGTLAFWNLADSYSSLPTLSDTWINEDKSNIDRVIAVPSQPQFIADIYVQNNTTRPMPVYSIPGLIDHH